MTSTSTRIGLGAHARPFLLFALLHTAAPPWRAFCPAVAHKPALRSGRALTGVGPPACARPGTLLRASLPTVAHNCQPPAPHGSGPCGSFETFAVAVFSIEYLTRLFTCPKLRAFVLAPLNIVDLLAIIPYYITVLMSLADGVLPWGSDANQVRMRVRASRRTWRPARLPAPSPLLARELSPPCCRHP